MDGWTGQMLRLEKAERFSGLSVGYIKTNVLRCSSGWWVDGEHFTALQAAVQRRVEECLSAAAEVPSLPQYNHWDRERERERE